MNNVKKIAVLLLVIAGMTGFSQAATHHSKPDATLRMSIGGSILESVSARGQERSPTGEKTIRLR